MRSFKGRQGAFCLSKGTFLGAQSPIKKVRCGCVLSAFLGGFIYPHTPYAFGSLGVASAYQNLITLKFPSCCPPRPTRDAHEPRPDSR
jgi:hypothetical protein